MPACLRWLVGTAFNGNDRAGAIDCDSRRAVGPTKTIRGVQLYVGHKRSRRFSCVQHTPRIVLIDPTARRESQSTVPPRGSEVPIDRAHAGYGRIARNKSQPRY